MPPTSRGCHEQRICRLRLLCERDWGKYVSQRILLRGSVGVSVSDQFLIVGAGSAGCVLADRLTAAGARVVLLEAGSEIDADLAEVVAGPSFLDALAQPSLHWPNLLARRTQDQDPRVYGRGRGVGGSSLVNAMVGLWGEVEDYDAWERDFGCVGWSWRDVEPYFRRIEVPLTKASTGTSDRVGHALVETCRTLGWELHRGPYPLSGIGRDVGPAVLTRDQHGRRVSAADAYLRRARSRDTLDIRPNSLVDRVIVEGRRARGVVLADGSEVAGGTVVLAAGAIHTPAILLRSGIDRPSLGFGLQDHPSAPITVGLRVPLDSDAVAVTALARFTSGEIPADLQLVPIDHLGAQAPGFGLISVALMFVESRGQVRLRSMDPNDEPEIDFALLSHDDDVRRLLFGVRHLVDLLGKSPLTDIANGFFIDDRGTQLADLPADDEALIAWLQRSVGDYVHASGTCAMGDSTQDTSVVDPSGNVIGYESLRVCDASIFPRLPRANTHFPVMMVAEVLAERWIQS